MMTVGIIIGIIGIVGVSVNYPIYKKLLESGKKQYAFELCSLRKKSVKKPKHKGKEGGST